MPVFSRFALRALPVVAICAASLVNIGSARAQVALLSNLDVPANNQGTINDPQGQKAITFTIGASPISFTSFQAALSLNTVNATSGTTTATLYTAAANDDPGTLITSLGSRTVTAPLNSPQIYTFSSAAPVLLAAGNRYTVLLDYTSGDDIFWEGTNPQTLPTARNGSGITNVVYRVSGNNGASYSTSSVFNQAQINGVVAPEPVSAALVAAPALFGILSIRRRKVNSR